MMNPFKMLGDINAMRKQAAVIQQALEKEEFEVVAGNVRVVITGNQNVKVVEIDSAHHENVKRAINEAIKKVYIDDSTKDKMINRLDELFQEESKASSSLSQEVKDNLKEFDVKLERLVDIFIDRQITQEEYAKRKAKLLNDKKNLEGKLKEIEKSGGGWLEPAKQFVSTCNQASSVAWQEILSPKKDFLKICGSNLVLKDTSLFVSYKKPYDLVAQSQGRLDWRRGRDSNPGTRLPRSIA